MNKKNKLIVSHPTGNANLRSLLSGLFKYGLLAEFHTSIATFPKNFWERISSLPGLGDFKRRTYDSQIQNLTRLHPFMELCRLLATKLKVHSLTGQEKSFFSVDQIYHSLDKSCSLRIKKIKPKAIYAYEDGAAYSFEVAKDTGIICLYDLPIGYWRSMRKLLEPELLNRPEWAATITGFKDSEQKVLRKDNELNLADHIFVASSFTKKTLADYPGNLAPIHVIPYGFPKVNGCKEYREISKTKLKLLFVGGLSQRKGIAQLFDAVNELDNQIELTVIGRKSIPDCDILNKSLARINWIPSMSHSEILKEMRKADVFVFPSLFEGYGLVIAEAMAQGTPVITTDRTCGADYIKNGINGWLLETIETKSLLNQLKEIIKNPEEIQKVGKIAYKTAAAHPTSEYGMRMANVIDNLLTEQE